MLRRALLAALSALPAASALAGLPVASALAQSNDPSFRIVNNTPNIINEVYASPADQRNWGHDRLGSEVVAAGGRQIIRLPQDGNCVYDVRIVYQGGTAEERRNVNTCGLVDLVLGTAAATPRQATPGQTTPGQGTPRQAAATGNPSFNLVNSSGRVIEEFYASPASQQAWGPDRLGDATVSPGATHAVRLPQGECSYDIRVVWQGGQSQERRNVNTCTMNNYVVR